MKSFFIVVVLMLRNGGAQTRIGGAPRAKESGPNSMVFTSNLMPDKWCEFFNEDESLKCALDRIFDDAVVYMIQGESYRGKNLETYSIATTANRNK